MKKYTIDDFLAGKVSVKCVTSRQKATLLKVCKENSIFWITGARADEFFPRYDVLSINPNMPRNCCLGHSDSKPTFTDDVVNFSELSFPIRRMIVITSDGDTTTAKMLVNGKEVKTTTAKRNPADKANWRIGAQTAFDRLWAKQEKPEKERSFRGFKVGDRVVIDCKNGNAMLAHGKHGRIVGFSFVDEKDWVWLELDERVYSHDSEGKAKPGYGCIVLLEQLTHEQPTKQKVREVNRPANVGEWVKIVNKHGWSQELYKQGDILQVTGLTSIGNAVLSCGGSCAFAYEYVVLEGYKPGRDA